ncbi:MAG TPA: hypothetical protein VMW86_01175 [Dehalococcoidales bacterium]|nr:hypothetical protein [Dehalococcoidales bacterium]
MKKVRLIIVALALAVALSGASGCEKSTPAEPTADDTVTPAPAESGFNLILKYGITARNEIDTYLDKFTKDMIADPPITIDLCLTEEEMDRIYQKMVEIDFFNYPEAFRVEVPPGENTIIRTPYSSYYFTVEYDSQIKKLRWADEIMNPDVKADKLRDLIELIRDIMESKEEYKELPEPTSAYQ